MELINLKGLNLTIEESRDIINFIAQKRGISTKKLWSTIKPNPKRKNGEILTTKTQQKITKTLQKVARPKITKNLAPQKLLKTEKYKNTQNLTLQKPSKPTKPKNLTPHKPLKATKQQILSKTKKRIEIIREKLKELHHKLSKSELKEIKKHLYNIENKKELIESETTKKYLDELDKKILKLDE